MFGFGGKAEDRQIILRFNKIFSEHGNALRQEIGSIIADHAANGLLKSGATVKRFYRALNDELSQAIQESLSLISNKTEHAGRYRSRLLRHLKDQVRHHSNAYNEILRPKVGMAVGGSGDAHAAAERLFRNCVASGLDEVDKYDDGLTAPKDFKWHQRHPIWTISIGAVVSGIVGAVITALF